MPEIDQTAAAALGWPKTKYAWVERERRWLCRAVPFERVVRSETFEDLYVTGTQLRLRRAVPTDGGPPMLRLGRKADVSPSVRLLTSIYLSPEEFRLLSALPGLRLRKTRHHLGRVLGADVSVDQFEGALSGLVLAEAEFHDTEAHLTQSQVTASVDAMGGDHGSAVVIQACVGLIVAPKGLEQSLTARQEANFTDVRSGGGRATFVEPQTELCTGWPR